MRKKAYLIDIKEGFSKPLEVEDDLEVFYKLLNCHNIDIVIISIKGKIFDFVVDDEGLIKQGNICSVYKEDFTPQLVGSVLIFGCGQGDGELKSLSDSDLNLISKQIIKGKVETLEGEKIIEALICD